MTRTRTHDSQHGRGQSDKVAQYREDGLEALDGIGGVRAMRLERDLGITTVRSIVDASVETLQEVWSIGPITAGRAMGQAQAIHRELTDFSNMSAPSPDASVGSVDDIQRVAVLFGSIDERGSLPDEVDIDDCFDAITASLDEAGVELRPTQRVGIPQASPTDEFGFMGGALLQTWFDKNAGVDTAVVDRRFEWPWEKYSHFLPEHETRGPDPGSFKQVVPDAFDVSGPDDIEVRHSLNEPKVEMSKWADLVVVPIAGDYIGPSKHWLSYHGADVYVGYELNDHGQLVEYEETETPDERGVNPEESVANRGLLVQCPQCEDSVLLDGENDTVRCKSCYEQHGAFTLVSTSNAAEVYGEPDVEEVTQIISDDPAVNELKQTEQVELGVVTREEEEWLPDKNDIEETAGAGAGPLEDKYS